MYPTYRGKTITTLPGGRRVVKGEKMENPTERKEITPHEKKKEEERGGISYIACPRRKERKKGSQTLPRGKKKEGLGRK